LQPQTPPTKPSTKVPDVKFFLPADATITKQITVDFTNGRKPASIVVAYQMLDEEGLRILEPDKVKGWKVAYREASRIGPGEDELLLQTVKAANGREGLVVVYYHSGAGTTSDWKVIAESNGKFVSQDAAPIRDKVLKNRHLIFGGYNGVSVSGDLVVETISGYSRGRARCCPDQLPVEVRVRFTGSSIKLYSVMQQKTLPAK
jgi:hypothetical protein